MTRKKLNNIYFLIFFLAAALPLHKVKANPMRTYFESIPKECFQEIPILTNVKPSVLSGRYYEAITPTRVYGGNAQMEASITFIAKYNKGSTFHVLIQSHLQKNELGNIYEEVSLNKAIIKELRGIEVACRTKETYFKEKKAADLANTLFKLSKIKNPNKEFKEQVILAIKSLRGKR
jgi:hypothetical protein